MLNRLSTALSHCRFVSSPALTTQVSRTCRFVYHMGGFDIRLTKRSEKCQPELFEYTGVINPLTKLDLFSANLPKFPLRERGLRKKGSLLSTGT